MEFTIESIIGAKTQTTIKLEGSKITLSNSIGDGAEGDVYDIASPSTFSSKFCAKIFSSSDNNKLKEKENKLKFMIKNPPQSLEGKRVRICWPIALMYDYHGNFRGYLMQKAFPNSIELYNIKSSSFLSSSNVPNNFKNSFNRMKDTGFINRVKLCRNLASAVAALHSIGAIIVDLKPQNIFITDRGHISVIDVDSLQIVDRNHFYRCTVSTPGYEPPEKYHEKFDHEKPIEKSWDNFSGAVIFYEILFGKHPFSAYFSKPYDKYTNVLSKIKHGLFPYGLYSKYYCPPSLKKSLHEDFYKLDSEARSLFIRAFKNGHKRPNERPSMLEFKEGFKAFLGRNTVKKRGPLKGNLREVKKILKINNKLKIFFQKNIKKITLGSIFFICTVNYGNGIVGYLQKLFYKIGETKVERTPFPKPLYICDSNPYMVRRVGNLYDTFPTTFDIKAVNQIKRNTKVCTLGQAVTPKKSDTNKDKEIRKGSYQKILHDGKIYWIYEKLLGSKPAVVSDCSHYLKKYEVIASAVNVHREIENLPQNTTKRSRSQYLGVVAYSDPVCAIDTATIDVLNWPKKWVKIKTTTGDTGWLAIRGRHSQLLKEIH